MISTDVVARGDERKGARAGLQPDLGVVMSPYLRG
jgi:hypothetical protein